MALPLAELISAQRSVRPGLAQLRVLLFFWVRLPRFLAVDGPRRLYCTGSVFIIVLTDTEMPGLRIVRVGSQNARPHNSFRTRCAVPPILPGFIGDALPRGKHALVNGPVHNASGKSDKDCATCLQENSSIHLRRL